MNRLLITVGCSVGIIILIIIHSLLTSSPTSSDKKLYKVVDQYKGCDVVRYASPNEARFHYFLDCNVH